LIGIVFEFQQRLRSDWRRMGIGVKSGFAKNILKIAKNGGENAKMRLRQRLVPLEHPPDPPDRVILSEGSGGRHDSSFGRISSDL